MKNWLKNAWKKLWFFLEGFRPAFCFHCGCILFWKNICVPKDDILQMATYVTALEAGIVSDMGSVPEEYKVRGYCVRCIEMLFPATTRGANGNAENPFYK